MNYLRTRIEHMAKGIGEHTARTGYNFYDLPDHEQQAAEAAACERYRVKDFFLDLGPAVRRKVRDQAVEDHLRKL
jgi:hypothetical protein